MNMIEMDWGFLVRDDGDKLVDWHEDNDYHWIRDLLFDFLGVYLYEYTMMMVYNFSSFEYQSQSLSV
jgi:hypothetical protein